MTELNGCYDCGTELPLLYSVTATRVLAGGKKSTQSIALCPECFKKETGKHPH